MAQESEDAQAVVDGNQDYTSLGPFVSVHGYFIAVAVHIGTAVDPQGHGKFGVLAQRLGRSPDVQIQAVFAFFGRAHPVKLISVKSAGLVAGLGGNGAEGVADPDALPGLYGLWSLPAEISYRSCGIGNAFENGDTGGLGRDSLNLSAFYGEDGVLLAAGGKDQHRKQY